MPIIDNNQSMLLQHYYKIKKMKLFNTLHHIRLLLKTRNNMHVLNPVINYKQKYNTEILVKTSFR